MAGGNARTVGVAGLCLYRERERERESIEVKGGVGDVSVWPVCPSLSLLEFVFAVYITESDMPIYATVVPMPTCQEGPRTTYTQVTHCRSSMKDCLYRKVSM